MKKSKDCKGGSCWWALRYELVGVIFLGLATFLTVITLNGFGIAAMFIVGMVLCCHKCLGCKICHSHSFEEELCQALDDSAMQVKQDKPAKAAVKKSKPAKKA